MIRLTLEGDVQGWIAILTILRMLYLQRRIGAGASQPPFIYVRAFGALGAASPAAP
jgi:hypothetical protein